MSSPLARSGANVSLLIGLTEALVSSVPKVLKRKVNMPTCMRMPLDLAFKAGLRPGRRLTARAWNAKND
jgi:hypothetical protein